MTSYAEEDIDRALKFLAVKVDTPEALIIFWKTVGRSMFRGPQPERCKTSWMENLPVW